jgi:hypothetical protein
MSIKPRQIVLVVFFLLILLIFVFSYIYSKDNSNRDFIATLSGTATVIVALLTLSYVYITSRQLDIMQKQLEENKKDRELSNQPLPWINDIKFYLEKPEFYYNPPQKEYSFQSRYFACFHLKNVGTSPAVVVDVSASLLVKNKNQKTTFSTAAIRVETLEEKQIYPHNEDEEDNNLMFAGDKKGIVLDALREANMENFPELHVTVLFRNVLGGCFLVNNIYRLYPKDKDQDSVFSNWLTLISSFTIKYKKELEMLPSLLAKDITQWSIVSEKVRQDLKQSLLGNDDMKKNEVDLWSIPNSLNITPIDKKEYQKETNNFYYGRKLPPSAPCNTKKEKKDESNNNFQISKN